MNAFEQASQVSAESWRIIQPLIQQRAFQGRYVVTSKGRIAKELQASVGDVLFNSDEETIWSIELKAERKPSRNLFLEAWSNRERFKAGWMWTLDADLLMYHFLASDDLYCIDFRRLKRWFHDCQQGDRPPWTQWPQKEQGIYTQRNDTWGVLVPIERIGNAVGYDLLHPGRGLTDTRHQVAQRHMEQLRLESGGMR